LGNPWWNEVWRFTGLLILALVFGLIFGQLPLAFLIAVSLYLTLHLRQLYLFERWLREGRRRPPDSSGMWGEVFHHLYRLQKRNRKRKKKLASMLSRFRESTAAMPDATVVMDADGVIEWWNDAASRLLGLRQQDTGQPITNLLRHPHFHEFLEREDFSNVVQFPAPTNTQTILSVRIIAYGKDQRLLVARDVTRMHLLEQMRRDFIANVSHELRTPLTVITGYVEALQDDDSECAQQLRRSLDAMQQQSSRMQQIVSDLLLLSRLETDRGQRERQEVDVPALLEMIKEDAVVLSRGQHAIRLQASPGLWLIGSRSELRSAFSNLVYNAVRYTPEGGQIDIRWYSDEKGAHFEVKDTGKGIAAHHLPRLTERFYRVDVGRSRETGGTGLGLAIVKHVLMRHDADLRIDSAIGKGSTFRCDFPVECTMQKPVKQLASES
jgi:two-component system phosphate regulon sensor histidine kinase PhoR